MFDLAESKRSLGIYTMILEIMYAIEKKKKYYYPGYAYEKPSFYEYKKKFDNVEFYDWQSGIWLPLNYEHKDVESAQKKTLTKASINSWVKNKRDFNYLQLIDYQVFMQFIIHHLSFIIT